MPVIPELLELAETFDRHPRDSIRRP